MPKQTNYGDMAGLPHAARDYIHDLERKVSTLEKQVTGHVAAEGEIPGLLVALLRAAHVPASEGRLPSDVRNALGRLADYIRPDGSWR